MAQLTSAQRDTFASSSSCSASIPCVPYDVFISHRGPDVKKTFAGHLYHRLKSRGLQVFLDKPELQAGHDISCQIKGAIEVASVHIAIFTENYAESKWCLEELVLMLNSKGTLLPVFYNVKPFELRWTEKGTYAGALQKHEEQQRYDLQTIGEWKKALSHVAEISGFELEACNGDEVELVDRVVQRVLKEVPKPPLHVAKYKVGLQEKLEDFERTVLSQLEEEGRLEAKVLGILGSGGIGKSTLAKQFFNNKRSNYDVSSFLFDVRENAATKSLNCLQSKLIEDLIGTDIQIKSWEEGIGILEKNLKSCHALIILDDIDHISQLDALVLPIKHVLDPKSLILVTSRDKHVLQSARIAESSIYPLKGLNRLRSLELFCWHAFFQRHPLPEFEDLVDGFLNACDGLPLSLEVFGALLCQENDRSYWEEQLNGLEMLPPEIQVRLKVSYDSLNPEEQQIFLDIACFSIGENKDKWIRIWGGSGWKGSVGLRNLENKCLVEVDGENKIRMHDHLRDMGRNIAQDRSMPRRLWGVTMKDVYDLLEQSSPLTEVRGIKMGPQSEVPFAKRFSRKVFKISKLQLLEAEGDLVESILSKVRSPNLNLIWLCWTWCPCSSLPSWIPMHDLRVLEVSGSKLKRLWRSECQAPLQLRELTIQFSRALELFPNSLRQLEHLESIELVDGMALATLPEELCLRQSLKFLNIRYFFLLEPRRSYFGRSYLHSCRRLKILPNSLGNLINLQDIRLPRCIELQTLPYSFGNLRNLQHVDLRGCVSLERLPDSLGNLTNMEHINISGCKRLETLPYSLGNLTNLQQMDLHGCESLRILPDSFGNLSKLQHIDLHCCKSLEKLPYHFGDLTNLQQIDLHGCESLRILPDSFGNLSKLQRIYLYCCKSLEKLPYHFGDLTNLQQIDLHGCESLRILPDSFGNLSKLQRIYLYGCKNLEILPYSFGNLTNLRQIDLQGCYSLRMLSDNFGNLTNLQHINLCYCYKLEMLPNSFGNLMNLQYIYLSHSCNLRMLSNSVENLPQLKHLHLTNCPRLAISNQTLGNITTLECLDLSGCLEMEVLPLQVVHQRSLQKLNLLGTNIKELPSAPPVCLSNLEVLMLGSPLLKVLPPWLGYLSSLKQLQLHGCQELNCFPDSVGQLSQLTLLDVSECGIQYLPPDVMKMNNLEILRVRGCPLRELPFKKVEGERQTSQSVSRSELNSSIDRGYMIQLKHINLYRTKISEVCFPEGVCPNLRELNIRWCNDLVEVGGLPTTLRRLDFRGCGALKKIGGLFGLEELLVLELRGCYNIVEVEELPALETYISMLKLEADLKSSKASWKSRRIYFPWKELKSTLKSLRGINDPFTILDYQLYEKDEDAEEMASLLKGVLSGPFCKESFTRNKIGE